MCWTDRKKPALLVTILSVLVILCGLTMIIEGVIFTKIDFVANNDDLSSNI